MPRKKIELQKRRRPALKEKEIAEALQASAGIQSTAAKMLRVSPPAISARIKTSIFLQEILEEIREDNLDIAESELLLKIREGNMTAIIFYLKTIGKSRGYTERYETSVDVRGGVLLAPGMMPEDQWVENEQRRLKEKEEKSDTKRLN